VSNSTERLTYYDKYTKDSKYKEAMVLIREEIINAGNTSYFDGSSAMSYQSQAALRTHALTLLGFIGDLYGYNEDLLKEAEEYYYSGIRLASEHPDLLSIIHLMMGQIVVYHIGIGEWNKPLSIPSTALKCINTSIKISQEIGNTYNLIIGYYVLASTYEEFGQDNLSKTYWKRFISIAKNYFDINDKKIPESEWHYYFEMLMGYLEYNKSFMDVQEVMDLVTPIEPNVNKYFTFPSVFYSAIIQRLSVAGDIEAAWEYFPLLDNYLEKSKKGNPDMKIGNIHFAEFDLRLVRSTINMYDNDFEKAISDLEFCKNIIDESERSTDYGLHRQLAICYENTDNFNGAIDIRKEVIPVIEKIRTSFTIEQKKTFFQYHGAREWYEGLQSDYANLYIKSKNETDFMSSIIISEKYRGRQLSEKLNIEEDIIDELKLNHIRDQLKSEEILITFTLMEPYFKNNSQIICSYIDSNSYGIFITPIDYNEVKTCINSISNKLSNSGSDIDKLSMELTYISSLIINDLRPMIKGKKKLLIISDGILNKIPFELLTIDSLEYRSMILDKNIVMLPSIKYMLQNENSSTENENSLLAIADPVFSQDYANSINLTNEEIIELARGSNYLNYFNPLPETRSEIKTISQLFQQDNYKLLMGSNATESKIKTENLKGYRFIHIASHGILGNELPGINEPAIVLSDENDEDGFLMASEVEKLELNAELTVLSACKTGTGEFIHGEGLISN